MSCCGELIPLQHNSSFCQCVMVTMHKDSESVIVEEFNSEWISWFETLCSFFEHKLDPYVLRIEHVGSTSIPGMVAKPIIDFDIVIRMSDFEEIQSRLEVIGYVHQGDLGIPEREAFTLHDLELKKRLPPHHLYVCDIQSKELHRHIAFRNYLHEHPEEAVEYSKIKEQLVKEHSGDREMYIQGKDSLVRGILGRALHWYDENSDYLDR
jgi:GrpB-like predicted nucleotidyltransferase (UPF0157 family)